MPRTLRFIKEIPEIAKSRFNYDPQTGVVTNCKGRPVGRKSPKERYGRVHLKCGHYLSHRLAWFLHYGEQPPAVLDHINGDPTDNRIANLRPATTAENLRNQAIRKNNKSGFKGVRWCDSAKAWHAAIRAGKLIHIGSYASKHEAAIAYAAASKVLHKEFGRLK